MFEPNKPFATSGKETKIINKMGLSEKEAPFKEHKLPDDMKKTIKQGHGLEGYDWETVDMGKLMADTKLDKDDTLGERRAEIWGDDPSKFKFDQSKIKNWMDYPIRLESKNGKYSISDGHHRLRALMNDGYGKAEVLVKKHN